MPNLRSGQEQVVLCELAAGSALGLPLPGVTELQQLLTDLHRQRGGTKTAFAQALGISLERLLKVLKNPSESLGVANLLRLAVVSGLAPGPILRMAGKDDVADLLEVLYGGTPKRPVTVQALPTLSLKAQRALAILIDEVDAPRRPKQTRKPRAKLRVKP